MSTETERRFVNQFVTNALMPPAPGTKAADLTERERCAVAFAAGVPFETVVEGGHFVMRTTHLVGIADRGDGGYIVGHRAAAIGEST